MCPCTLIAAPPEEPQTPLLPYTQTFQDNIRAAHHKVREATRTAAKIQKSYFDSHVKSITFTEGQWVWLYHPHPLLRQRYRKLQMLWQGPYVILEFLSDVVVTIQHLRTSKKQTVHVDSLFPWRGYLPSDLNRPSTPTRVPPSHQTASENESQHQTDSEIGSDTDDQPQSPSTPQRSKRRRLPPLKLRDYDTS